LDTLRSHGASSEAQKGAEFRMFGGVHSRISVVAPIHYAADVWCIHAEINEDGELAKVGQEVAWKIFPRYKIKTAISFLKPEKELSTGDLVVYHLDESIQRAVLVRVPQLRGDPSRAILRSITEKLPIPVDVADDASRKERTCEGCGITWRKTMPRCMRCLAVRYCSTACQRAHWKEHKKACTAHGQNK